VKNAIFVDNIVRSIWRASNQLLCVEATPMKRLLALVSLSFLIFGSATWTHAASRVVDIPTRPGVTQRILFVSPAHPKAAVILFPGHHGGLQISSDGRLKWGEDNFLVRTRDLFAAQGLLTAVVDAPSDRQSDPYLGGFRYTREHVADIKAVIAWLKQQAKVPVWLIGTSMGTQSAAIIGIRLPVAAGGPDGLVLTSTILRIDKVKPVPDLLLGKIGVPVLVVHHKQDGCEYTPYSEVPRLMAGLSASPRKELLTVDGGQTRQNPCSALTYHGFFGIEKDVVTKIAQWITAR
jgi:dienelactone hydrolase